MEGEGQHSNSLAPGGGEGQGEGQATGQRGEPACNLPSIPMGRLIEADDVAKAALCLASHLAEMITGHVLEVDGGRAI